MNFKNINFSKILGFIIPVFIFVFIVAGFYYYRSDLDNVYRIRDEEEIVEGITWPSTNISPTEAFLADPLLVFTNDTNTRILRQNISKLIFSTLFTNLEGEKFENNLIESYTFDATNFKGKLKESIFWSDGKPLTANDVIFTMNLIRIYGNQSFYSPAMNGGAFKIEAQDDLNFTISLLDEDSPRQNQSYVQLLTFPILPAHYFGDKSSTQIQETLRNDFARNPLGSGILRINEYKSTELELVPNERYTKEKVNLKKYTFRLYQDISKLIEDFRLKNVDLATLNDYFDQNEIIRQLGNVVDIHFSILKNQRYALYFNLNDQTPDTNQETNFFKKFISLRRSLLYLVDRQVIIDSLENKNVPVFGPINSDSWAYAPDIVKTFEYNVQEFEKTIKTLGFVKNETGTLTKDGIPLKLNITYLSGSIRDKVIEEIEKQLESQGIVVELTKLSNTSTVNQISFDQVINSRTYQVILSEVSSNTSPDLYSEWHSSAIQPPGANLSNYSNSFVDRVLTDARLTSDINIRKAEYIKFQRRFFDDSPAIYLLSTSYATITNGKINFSVPEYSSSTASKYEFIYKWDSVKKYKY